MELKSNTAKAPDFESHPYHKIVLPTVQRFFYFSLKLHIFTTKKIQIKVPRQMFKNVTKFKLLGGSMVTTPSCHLALVWSI
jgi:hypothetical protein